MRRPIEHYELDLRKAVEAYRSALRRRSGERRAVLQRRLNPIVMDLLAELREGYDVVDLLVRVCGDGSVQVLGSKTGSVGFGEVVP